MEDPSPAQIGGLVRAFRKIFARGRLQVFRLSALCYAVLRFDDRVLNFSSSTMERAFLDFSILPSSIDQFLRR